MEASPTPGQDASAAYGEAMFASHPVLEAGVEILGIEAITDIVAAVAETAAIDDVTVAPFHTPWSIHNH